MDIPAIGTYALTGVPLESYSQMSFVNTTLINKQNHFSISPADITQPIISVQATEDQFNAKEAAVDDKCAQRDQIVPTLRCPLKNNKFIEIIMKNSEERRKVLNKLLETKNKKHPVEIFFEGLAKTVMSLPPALASEAQLKINSILIDLKYRSLDTKAHGQAFVSCSPSRYPASEYYSPSSATPSSKYCQSYNLN
ncbi:uncharacterized protein LOC111042616 [Myzus persicae]|uniref:uncharacterized protein LOC111042616 n=1 Tax=Myzus persicae TaxID=13164 RepID=UPI000B937393|nr:uncharacterized protein LOC111042616 [Myzus persicae]